ncbi:MAG: PH domain-containing protein [Candidatus Micrarchaeota archaeon]
MASTAQEQIFKPRFAFMLYPWLIWIFILAMFAFFPALFLPKALNLSTWFAIPIWILLTAIISICSYKWAKLQWQNYSVTLSPDVVTIKHGVISKNVSSFSYKEIQEVDLVQDFLSMILSASTLKISTMSFQSGFSGIIPGIRTKDAEYIKSIILSKKAKSTQKSTTKSKAVGVAGVKQTTCVSASEENVFTSAVLSRSLYYRLLALKAIITFISLVFIGLIATLSSIPFDILILLVYVGFGLVFSFGVQAIIASTFKFELRETQTILSYSIIFSNVKTSTPFSAIQDLTISQGPLEKLFSLYSLKVQSGARQVYSQNESGKAINAIPALTFKEAQRLRAELLKRMD